MSRNHTQDKLKLVERLNHTPIVEVACKQAGVPRSTYYRWRKQDEVFAETCDEALEQSTRLINDMAESQLISAIQEKNMTAIIFWLKHHHRTYRTRLEIDANVRSEQQALTPEQAVMVAEALRLAGLSRLPEGELSGGG
jgi:ACT domain-containing protein